MPQEMRWPPLTNWNTPYRRSSEQKDIEAFKTVIARTDHPTEKEFLLICRENFRDFELRRLESTNHIPRPTAKHDIRETTTQLWRKIWFKEIDIDREITGPVYEEILEIGTITTLLSKTSFPA
ncbi:MAG: hypothetical protein JO151_15835 [Verrucomicrobia bacterium]|nr:hypothetical protein [Verrucomicrobiota bacterium]